MLTETEIAINKIAEAEERSISQIIKDIIAEHEGDERWELMRQGFDYYHNENLVLDEPRQYFDGEETSDEDTFADNRVPHGWHKLLVDQKAGYIAGKPPVIEAEDEEFQEDISDLLGGDFDDKMPELVKSASNKGRAWLHVYVDSEGDFRFMEVDPRQIVPIYDTDKQQELMGVLRYYSVTYNGEKLTRVEWWDRERVRYFIKDSESGEYKPDTVIRDEEDWDRPHFTKNGEDESWGRIPFIKFANNKEGYPDIKYYKEMIDLYDRLISAFGNELEDLQEVIYILENYGGEDLEEFQKMLRKFKAVKVDENGGVDTLDIDIPTEAKKELLDRLEENILLFGQGVNPKTDRFGTSPSGVALQFLFSQLDMKADALIRKFKKGFRELAYFIARYKELEDGADHDPSEVSATFNKSMIFNESEKIENVQNSLGVTSTKTALANHPYVDDVDKEMKRIEDEMDDVDDTPDLDDIDLDDEGEEGEEEGEEE